MTYNERLEELIAAGTVSLKGSESRMPPVFDEMIMDVNTDYFEQNGSYEYACRFYEEAFHFAEKVYGKDNIISAVMHADELNVAMAEKYGRPIYHYHLHIMALPVVDKEVRWTKRCKDPELVGKVKEVIHQVSHSKKWRSEKAVDEDGNPILNSKRETDLPRFLQRSAGQVFRAYARTQASRVLFVESVAAPPKT
ncbi:MAG: plasmid recombination protein [Acutalibacteraceae bacterium]